MSLNTEIVLVLCAGVLVGVGILVVLAGIRANQVRHHIEHWYDEGGEDVRD